MTSMKKALLFFTLATMLSTVGMIFLKPWIITENIDGVAISPGQYLGYVLLVLAFLANLATTVMLLRMRAWQWQGIKLWRKWIALTAGLVPLAIFNLLAYLIAAALAQMIAQPF